MLFCAFSDNLKSGRLYFEDISTLNQTTKYEKSVKFV